MAKKNKIPQTILDAPKHMWAYAEDKDGNPIAFEGPNRAERRKHWIQTDSGPVSITMWNTNKWTGHYGYSRPSLSAMSRKAREKLKERS